MFIKTNELEQKKIDAFWSFIDGENYIYQSPLLIQRMHNFVRFRKIKPILCKHCQKKKELELSNNKKHKYTFKLEDYDWLCYKCHGLRDRGRFIEIKKEYFLKKEKGYLYNELTKFYENNIIRKNIKDFFENILNKDELHLDGKKNIEMVTKTKKRFGYILYKNVVFMIEEDLHKDVKIDNMGRLVIPKELRNQLNIKDDDELEIRKFGCFIALYPKNKNNDIRTFENLYNKQKEVFIEISVIKKEFIDLREMVINAVINKDYGLVKDEIKKLIKEVINEDKKVSPFQSSITSI